jgi:hypothetical protein
VTERVFKPSIRLQVSERSKVDLRGNGRFWRKAAVRVHVRSPLVRYLRKDLKAARTSSENSFGSSQAAKCPPRSTSLK